jgi:hypothetical protein
MRMQEHLFLFLFILGSCWGVCQEISHEEQAEQPKQELWVLNAKKSAEIFLQQHPQKYQVPSNSSSQSYAVIYQYFNAKLTLMRV